MNNFLSSIFSKEKCPELSECVPFKPEIDKGYVVDVYDGDTFTLASKYPGLKNSPYFKFQVRILGIDCPEIKTKRKNEKELGTLIRGRLERKIMKRKVTLTKGNKKDPYGRLLAHVYLDSESIGNWLLAQGFAKPYDGKSKRKPWTDQEIEKGLNLFK